MSAQVSGPPRKAAKESGGGTGFRLPGVSFLGPDDFASEQPRRIFVKSDQTGLGVGQSAAAVSVGRLADVESDLPRAWVFDEVVDRDQDEVYETYMNEQLVGRLLESTVFRLVILFIIVANSITVGIQTDGRLLDLFTSLWDACDNIFLTIFVLEIFLKWYHGFFSFWRVGWNIFDFIIVAVSVLGSGISFVSSGRVLRILRVLRAFRSLRSISALQGLQVIVQTVLVSLPDMVNIFLLLGIISFIFSIIGISLFGQGMPAEYGDLGKSMFSLFVAVTQDGWMNNFRTAEKAGYYYSAAVFYFFYIVIGAFVFGNLISGVVVTNIQAAFHAAKVEKKARSRNLAASKKDHPDSEPLIVQAVSPPLDPAALAAQTPAINPSLGSLSVAKFENYMLILTAVESNLRERSMLRAKLENIVRDVKEVNDTFMVESSEESSVEDVEASGGPSEEEGGDVLTHLIRRDAGANRRAKMRREAAEQRDRARREAQLEALEERKSKVQRAQQWALGGLIPGAQQQDNDESSVIGQEQLGDNDFGPPALISIDPEPEEGGSHSSIEEEDLHRAEKAIEIEIEALASSAGGPHMMDVVRAARGQNKSSPPQDDDAGAAARGGSGSRAGSRAGSRVGSRAGSRAGVKKISFQDQSNGDDNNSSNKGGDDDDDIRPMRTTSRTASRGDPDSRPGSRMSAREKHTPPMSPIAQATSTSRLLDVIDDDENGLN